MNSSRREWLIGTGSLGAGIILSACSTADKPRSGQQSDKGAAPEREENENEEEVSAVEDLMREHGVLRRALLVYQEAATKIRANPSSVAPDAIQRTAKLFRSFGEDYHEKMLEETHIFPAIKQAGGIAGTYPDILIAQHKRGRELTDYILAVAQGAQWRAGNTEPLAKVMESFVRMYQQHAAREDTIIFPAWKRALPADQLDEMGDKFEEIEQQQFGKDGFEDAVKQMSEIETSLGLADLAQFTAMPPPAVK